MKSSSICFRKKQNDPPKNTPMIMEMENITESDAFPLNIRRQRNSSRRHGKLNCSAWAAVQPYKTSIAEL